MHYIHLMHCEEMVQKTQSNTADKGNSQCYKFYAQDRVLEDKKRERSNSTSSGYIISSPTNCHLKCKHILSLKCLNVLNVLMSNVMLLYCTISSLWDISGYIIIIIIIIPQYSTFEDM